MKKKLKCSRNALRIKKKRKKTHDTTISFNHAKRNIQTSGFPDNASSIMEKKERKKRDKQRSQDVSLLHSFIAKGFFKHLGIRTTLSFPFVGL